MCAERNTRVRASQIRSIYPTDIEATNAFVDNYIPSYDEATGKFTWVANEGGGGGAGTGGYTASFTDASLSSAGILVVNHSLATTYPLVIIYDNNNLVITPDEIEYKTTNQIEIDLSSFGTLSGTWNIRVNSGASVSSLEDIADVEFDSGTPADNYVLIYDSASGKWKAEALVINTDKIEEGNSRVEVVDTGSGYIQLVIDGVEQIRVVDGKWYPILDNDIDIGDATHGIKDLYVSGTIYGASPLNFGIDGITINAGQTIDEFSIDGTLVGNSDTAIPTEKAVKTYVDNAVPDLSASVDDFTIKYENSELKVADRIENNIMLLAFYRSVDNSKATFNLLDGLIDEYEDETGIDTGASTYETYNATDDYYATEVTIAGISASTKLMLHCDGQDGGKEIIDSGNTGHVGTQYGTSILQTAEKKIGSSALFLDGNSDYVTFPDHADWDLGTGDFTIDFWINFSTLPGSGDQDSIISHWLKTGVSTGAWDVLMVNSGGTYTLRLVIKTGGELQVSEVVTPVTGTWYHYAIVRESGTAHIYEDGVETGTGTSASSTMSGGSPVLEIGRHDNGTHYVHGYMDEVRISDTARWSTDFTPETSQYTSDANTLILLHFDTHDISPSYHIPTFFGNAQIDTAVSKWGTGSFLFDGSSDYVQFPASSDWNLFSTLTDDITIDFWVKFADHVGGESLIGQYEGNLDFWTIWHTHGTGLEFYVESGGAQLMNMTPGGEISDTNWHHVCLVKKGDVSTPEYAIYLDGSQVTYLADNATDTFSGVLYLGQGKPGVWRFDGNLDEVRVQHSNAFNATPNVGITDTIDLPTGEYTTIGVTHDMTLISDSVIAEADPSTARLVLFQEDVDAITINTDIKGWVSKDGGSTWAQVTLADDGNYDASKRVLSGTVDLTASGIGAGTSMEYKITTHNAKEQRIHGTGMNWD